MIRSWHQMPADQNPTRDAKQPIDSLFELLERLAKATGDYSLERRVSGILLHVNDIERELVSCGVRDEQFKKCVDDLSLAEGKF